MQKAELTKILKKPGYGLKSSLQSDIGKAKAVRSQIDGKGAVPDVERSSGPKPLGTQRVALKAAGMCTVRIKVFRRRLADPDGNCCKYTLDAIARSGALVDDSARYIRIIYEGQEKVETNEEERVEFVLEYEGVDINDLWKPIGEPV